MPLKMVIAAYQSTGGEIQNSLRNLSVISSLTLTTMTSPQIFTNTFLG